MNFFAACCLATFFSSTAFGAFTAFNAKKPIHKIWVLFNFTVALWGFCAFKFATAKFPEASLFWLQVGHFGVILIPILYFHFVLELLKQKRINTMRAIYGIGIAFLVLNSLDFLGYTKLFITEVTYVFDEFYVDRPPGPFYPAFVSFFFLLVIYSHGLALREVKKAKGITRVQINYFLWAMAPAFYGGGTAFIMVFGIDFYPFLHVTVPFYPVVMTYSIVRHSLLDFQIIIRRTLIFAGLLGFVFGVFLIATFIVKDVLGGIFGVNNFWVNGISIFLIVLGYDPIRRVLVNLTDKYFFQKKYDYQKLLKDASRGISKIESLHRLLSLVVHFITMKMRVKNAAILSRVKETGGFKIEFQRGYNKNFFEYAIPSDNELLKFLKEEHEAIDLQKIEQYIEAGDIKQQKGQDPRRYDFDAIKKTMKELDVVCCVPSYLGKELRNILMLGEKKSGDYFVEQDLNVLYTLAQESAIAIENARLYDEAINKSSELEDINGQLEYAKDLLMKALRDTEVANKQLQDTQAQLIHEQKMATLGRLAASVGHEVNNPLTILSMNVSRVLLKLRKNPDLKVTEIMDTFDKMEQNIGRIKAVVNTLTGLLKKSEKGKFEPLSLKLILEETLPLVQFQTYLDNLTGTEVEFDIPGNIPLIRGDLERLQEVFLNLFINAYHAMEGKQHRKIRVHAEIDPEDTDMVAIRFRDNGKGMDEETQKKIFNYRFTTKGPGKGSGLGLYMCKYIIELHGGAINVYSKLGEGTSFVIHLPSVDKKIEAKGLPSDLEQSYHTAQEEGTDQGNQASAG